MHGVSPAAQTEARESVHRLFFYTDRTALYKVIPFPADRPEGWIGPGGGPCNRTGGCGYQYFLLTRALLRHNADFELFSGLLYGDSSHFHVKGCS